MSDNQSTAQQQQPVMVCKLVLHHLDPNYYPAPDDLISAQVQFGAVWEGSRERQLTENAVFGHMTPQASFNAIIKNPAVVEKLVQGETYYVTFSTKRPTAVVVEPD